MKPGICKRIIKLAVIFCIINVVTTNCSCADEELFSVGNCCEASITDYSCSNQCISECVCSLAPYCCAKEWSNECVALVDSCLQGGITARYECLQTLEAPTSCDHGLERRNLCGNVEKRGLTTIEVFNTTAPIDTATTGDFTTTTGTTGDYTSTSTTYSGTSSSTTWDGSTTTSFTTSSSTTGWGGSTTTYSTSTSSTSGSTSSSSSSTSTSSTTGNNGCYFDKQYATQGQKKTFFPTFCTSNCNDNQTYTCDLGVWKNSTNGEGVFVSTSCSCSQSGAPNSNTNSSSNNTVPVAIGVVIGVVALALLAAVICFVRLKKKKKSDTEKGKSEEMLETIPICKNVTVLEKLGGGNFGEVYRGEWKGSAVALKMLKSKEQYEEFEKECRVLFKVRNPNMLQFMGVYTDDKKEKFIVTEFMAMGNLLNLIKENSSISVDTMIDMSRQAAAGMSYLEGEKIVHRDLALRNLLVGMSSDSQYIIKVSDFGLSRTMTENYTYYQKDTQSQIPIKWSAPETVQYGKSSVKSDVWSFGICLWELFSRGMIPYAAMSNSEAVDKVIEGYRLPKPKDCPDEVYSIMMSCWDVDPAKRPSFEEILNKLSKLCAVFNSTKAPKHAVEELESAPVYN